MLFPRARADMNRTPGHTKSVGVYLWGMSCCEEALTRNNERNVRFGATSLENDLRARPGVDGVHGKPEGRLIDQ